MMFDNTFLTEKQHSLKLTKPTRSARSSDISSRMLESVMGSSHSSCARGARFPARANEACDVAGILTCRLAACLGRPNQRWMMGRRERWARLCYRLALLAYRERNLLDRPV